MISQLAGPRLLRTRLLVALFIVASAAAGLRLWSSRGPVWIDVGTGVVFVVLLVAAASTAVAAPGPPARFTLTGGGFGVRSRVRLELTVVALAWLLGWQANLLVVQWRDVARSDGPIVDGLVSAGWLSVAFLLGVVAVASLTWVVWHGPAVELTPVGIRSRAPLHSRLIPWDALVVGPSNPAPEARRVRLTVDRPELVAQRGWGFLNGTRQHATLQADTDARLLADAIRWYARHPADRAAIGTAAEHDRLVAGIAAEPADHQVEPPPPAAVPATGPAAGPAQPVRPRQLGIVAALVGAAVVVTLVTAVAEFVIAIMFRDNLYAAERAIAAGLPAPVPGEELLFSTDTVTFATNSAAIGLVVTVAGSIIAFALLRAVRARSDAARLGLSVLCGLAAVVALCPFLWPVANLAADPAAGTLLNVWSAVRLLTNPAVMVVAVSALALLQDAHVIAYARRLT